MEKSFLMDLIKSMARKEFRIDPLVSGDKILLIRRSRENYNLYAKIVDNHIVFWNVYPCIIADIITLESDFISTFCEEDWINVKVSVSEDANLSEISERISVVLKAVKEGMMYIVDTMPEESFRFYGGFKINILDHNFFYVDLGNIDDIRKFIDVLQMLWAPYTLVSNSDVNGFYYFRGTILNKYEPLLVKDSKIIFFLLEDEVKEVDLAMIKDRVLEISKIMLKLAEKHHAESDEHLISEIINRIELNVKSIFDPSIINTLERLAIRYLDGRYLETITNLRKLVDIAHIQDIQIVEKMASKIINTDPKAISHVIKRIEKDAKKYRGQRVISLRESELGIEFPKKAKITVERVGNKKRIIIEF